MTPKAHILIPVFNDWEALNLLLVEIAKEGSFEVFIANDCSSQKPDIHVPSGIRLRVINLLRNLGHQKAIAIGLAYLTAQDLKGNIIVMDADGEDMPSAIPALLNKSQESPESIVFAHRSKRSEGFIFKFFYGIYKAVFVLLTGKAITFGNFSCVPVEQLKKVAFLSEIWNNYPGGIIKSKLPFTSIPIERGKRLAGESKMNFVSLVMHGMSAISVFLDTTAVRILIFAVFMVLFSLIGIGVVFELKFIENMATPGWASSLASTFFIIMLQGFFISLFLVFMVLNYRGTKQFIPLEEYQSFILNVEEHS